jgi:hypothetical protein
MMVRPSGFSSLAANLAVVLSPLTPTEHNTPEASNTLRLASRAMRGVPTGAGNASRREASSREHSMSGVISCSACLIAVEVAA